MNYQNKNITKPYLETELCTMNPQDSNSKVCAEWVCTFKYNHVAKLEAQSISKLDPSIMNGCAVRVGTSIPHLQFPCFLTQININVVSFLPKGSDNAVISWYILHE